MGFWERIETRVKDFTVVDIGLIKWSVFFVTILIVKLFPQLLKISTFILSVLTLACAAKPLYKFLIKKTVL